MEDECDVFHESNSFTAGSVVGRSADYTRFLRERGVEELEDHILLPEFGARGRQSVDSRPSPLAFDESQEGWLANTAISTMQTAAAQDKPFLLHVSFPRPHQCTTPCQEFWDLYNTDDLSLPPNADYDLAEAGKAPHMIASAQRWRESDWQLFRAEDFRGRTTAQAARLPGRSQSGGCGGRQIAGLPA